MQDNFQEVKKQTKRRICAPNATLKVEKNGLNGNYYIVNTTVTVLVLIFVFLCGLYKSVCVEV